MERDWGERFANPNIERFIRDHGLALKDIRTQAWLGSDVWWQHGDDGWEILVYPPLYYAGQADLAVLHALAHIQQRTAPYFQETPAEEFNRLKDEYLSSWPDLSPDDHEFVSSILVQMDQGICGALEVDYLLRNGYLDLEDLRSLIHYRSEMFVDYKGALLFLSSMAVLRRAGGDVSLLHDRIIKQQWYSMFPILDRLEECLAGQKARFADTAAVHEMFFPQHKEQGLLEKINRLRRNVIGPRDPDELDYDVAISYAAEDRELAELIAACLRKRKVSVFYDRDHTAETWGRDLYGHLTDLYGRRARCCLVIVSRSYVKKQWTTLELEAARERAVSQNASYILPLRVDDAELPGMPPGTAYVSATDHSPTEICDLLVRRVELYR